MANFSSVLLWNHRLDEITAPTLFKLIVEHAGHAFFTAASFQGAFLTASRSQSNFEFFKICERSKTSNFFKNQHSPLNCKISSQINYARSFAFEETCAWSLASGSVAFSTAFQDQALFGIEARSETVNSTLMFFDFQTLIGSQISHADTLRSRCTRQRNRYFIASIYPP